MNNVSVIRSRSFAHNAKVPWGTFVFLAAVFFVAEHDLSSSVREGFSKPPESQIREITEGSLERRVVFSMLGLFGIVSLMRKGGNRLRINGLLGWLVLFYLMWCFLSLAWADNTALTFRRLVVLAMLSLGALAVSQRFSLRSIILLVFFTAMLYLFVGLLSEMILGTFRAFAPGYRFAGTLLHPNTQALNCAVLLFTAVSLAGTAKRGRGFFLAGALVALIFLILTKSRTAFASAMIAVFAYWSLVSPARRKLALILGTSLILCLVFLLFGDAAFPALRQGILLGREDPSIYTLTGRIPLWKQGLQFAARRPLLGYGYNSFFGGSHMREMWASLGWVPIHAHSAYLEQLLSLGVIGLLTYVLVLVVGIKRCFLYYRASVEQGYAFFGILLMFCFLDGLLESAIVNATVLTFLSFVALARLAFHRVPKTRFLNHEAD